MKYSKKFQQLKQIKQGGLIPFLVIGDPDFDTSLKLAKTCIESGADVLELGFPFSDPVADGPTIQAADQRALFHNITRVQCFNFIKRIREFSDIPIGLLIYANLITNMGIHEFYKEANKVGVTSILIADVPVEEAEPFIEAAKANNVDTVFLVTQTTSDERMEIILNKCQGFVYLVSRLGVTGAKNKIKSTVDILIKKVRTKTDLPIAVGFGISTPDHVKSVISAGADAAIVGSGLIKLIEQNLDSPENMYASVKDYITELKEATKTSSAQPIFSERK